MNVLKSLFLSLGLVVALPGWAQIEPATAPVGEVQLIELKATVEIIDLENRMLTVKGPKGGVVTTQVSPKVENLDKLKVGDKVRVKYYRAVLRQAEKLGEDAKRGGSITRGGIPTISGEPMPEGVTAREVDDKIEILVVDPYKKAIAFRGWDGRYREISVDKPEKEHYLKELKEGDMVRVVYREALAVAVDKE